MKRTLRIISAVLVLAMMCASMIATSSASYSGGVFVFDSADCESWLSGSHSLDWGYNEAESALELVATGGDPYILLNVNQIASVSATRNKAVSIVYKAMSSNSSSATQSELFLSAGSITGPTAGYSNIYTMQRTSSYVAQTIDLSTTSWWSGTVNNIRIDPFCSCANGDTLYVDSIIIGSDFVTARKLAEERIADRTNVSNELGDLACTSYENDKYTSPFWKGNIVYNEAIFPETDASGNMTYTLMYTPDEVLTVYNATFSAMYTEGVDYTVDGDKITFLKSGSIKYYDYTYVHPQSNPNGYDNMSGFYTRTAAGDGKWERWGGSIYYTDYINVTYTHSDEWEHYVPESKADLLPNTTEKLTSNDNLNVVFFGDSICGGANASSYRNVYPYAEFWNEQIITRLEETYGLDNINYWIESVGGSTASDMVSHLSSSVFSHSPDLVFIEFGVNDCMNESQSGDSDAGAYRVSNEFSDAVETMILQIKENYPECEIVLVAPFYPNIYCHYASYIDACTEKLHELEAAYSGVAVADVTAMMGSLMEFKTYTCFNGDNMCHPNDFAMRLYSQVCLATILPDEMGYDAYMPSELETINIEWVNPSSLYIDKIGTASANISATGNQLTYKWSCLTEVPDGIEITSSASNALTLLVISPLTEDAELQFVCTVTDVSGNKAVSDPVTLYYDAPEEGEAVPGDIDGDGHIVAEDVLCLRKYLGQLIGDIDVIVGALDMNGDSRVNAMDVLCLRRHLAQ